MTIENKLQLLKADVPQQCSKVDYYQMMFSKMDALKTGYYDYMITEPINCDEELKRVEDADFDLCCALMTMLFREDRFAQYGRFERRYEDGDVQRIIDRMIKVIE